MRVRIGTYLLLSALAGAPTTPAWAQRSADAQSASHVPFNARVRLTLLPAHRRAEGRLHTVDSAAVFLRPETRGAAVRRFERKDVETLEVYRGRAGVGPRAAGGFLIGALAGGLVLGGFGYLATQDDGDMSGFGAILGAPVGALIGGLIGLGVGVGKAPERWDAVPLPTR